MNSLLKPVGGGLALCCLLTLSLAAKPVDFVTEVRPILERSCLKCHGNGKRKGGFNLDHPHALEAGGESGPVVIAGRGAESLLIKRVTTRDEDERMPSKGDRLSPAEIAVLTAWIDQGMPWEKGFSFRSFPEAPLAPREVVLPGGPGHPVDRLLAPYLKEHALALRPVSDSVFVRRAFLDILGLLPTPQERGTFVADRHPDKRARLVESLLGDHLNYSEHWISFWNDCLRNSYTRQYHGGGSGQITTWLKETLLENRSYLQMVRELIDPVKGSGGFIDGVRWRGTVNASQTPEMQAAQNISQVFLGLNLKCASCHDSFISGWSLKQTYEMAAVFSSQPLEIHRCNKSIGEVAHPGFLYPELGRIDATAKKPDRVKQLVAAMTHEGNGRLARTVVNRLWTILLGRGLVEPVDEMDNPPWHADLLDWLAVDFADQGYNLKQLIARIMSSRAYQALAVPLDPEEDTYLFRGPVVRRLSAEQFLDGLEQVVQAGSGARAPQLQLPAKFDPKKAAFHSSLLTGTKTKQVDIPLNGAEVLVLAVEQGKKGTQNDHADWAEPVLHGPDGKKIPLTDLEWTKASSGWGKVLKNRTVTGQPMRIAGTAYAQGLGTHAPSVIVYELPEGVNRFTATVGIDEVASNKPNNGADLVFHVHTLKGLKNATGRGIEGKRAGVRNLDRLMRTLGRPKRDIVVTRRESLATTAQMLELSNGAQLSALLARGGKAWAAQAPEQVVEGLFAQALGRAATAEEKGTALELIGAVPTPQGVEDLIWILALHPEFQLIY
jgi:hypothetical protein